MINISHGLVCVLNRTEQLPEFSEPSRFRMRPSGPNLWVKFIFSHGHVDLRLGSARGKNDKKRTKHSVCGLFSGAGYVTSPEAVDAFICR